MKNILVNPKVLINKKRKEVNDVIDQALVNWLIKNSYNPIIISNKNLIMPKKKFYKFLILIKIEGIVLLEMMEIIETLDINRRFLINFT